MKPLFLILCLALLCSTVSAQLIVTKEKDGTLKLSNVADRTVSLPRSSSIRTMRPAHSGAKKSKKAVKPLSSTSIPFLFKVKIRELARHYNLREDLVFAVAKAESSFNPLAISPKGAVGIMQLMKATARQYGVENRFNVEQNLQAGIRHLKILYDKYNGNIPLTLAAYNAGEEAVRKYNGVPPYTETREYIRRVLGYMGMNMIDSAFSSQPENHIYRYINADGQTVLTDSPPPNVRAEIIY